MPPVLQLSEIPTLSILYKNGRLSPSKSISSSSSLLARSSGYNDIISLIRTDLTTLRVSAIVNAANTSLRGGGGVDGAIHAKAGPALLAECRMLGGCPTGSAKITTAYRLPCEKVIHAVGPIYRRAHSQGPSGRARELLTSCYRESLDLALEHGCDSVAFSCLSTGVYGYPSGQAAEVALTEVRRWLDARPMTTTAMPTIPARIIFCCFEAKDMTAYEEWLPKIFPPSAIVSTLISVTTKHEGKAATLPDGPSNKLIDDGNPSASEIKANDDTEDWEAIERPEGSAVNGAK